MYTYRGVNACWCWHSINQSWAVLHFLERKGFWKKNQLERKSSQEKIISKKFISKETLLEGKSSQKNLPERKPSQKNLYERKSSQENVEDTKFARKKNCLKEIFLEKNILERKSSWKKSWWYSIKPTLMTSQYFYCLLFLPCCQVTIPVL